MDLIDKMRRLSSRYGTYERAAEVLTSGGHTIKADKPIIGFSLKWTPIFDAGRRQPNLASKIKFPGANGDSEKFPADHKQY